MGIEVFLLDRNFSINTCKYNNIYDLPYMNTSKLLRQNLVYEQFGQMQLTNGQLGDVIFSECIRSINNHERTRNNHEKEEEQMWIAIICFDNLMFSRVEGTYDYSFL